MKRYKKLNSFFIKFSLFFTFVLSFGLSNGLFPKLLIEDFYNLLSIISILAILLFLINFTTYSQSFFIKVLSKCFSIFSPVSYLFFIVKTTWFIPANPFLVFSSKFFNIYWSFTLLEKQTVLLNFIKKKYLFSDSLLFENSINNFVLNHLNSIEDLKNFNFNFQNFLSKNDFMLAEFKTVENLKLSLLVLTEKNLDFLKVLNEEEVSNVCDFLLEIAELKNKPTFGTRLEGFLPPVEDWSFSAMCICGSLLLIPFYMLGKTDGGDSLMEKLITGGLYLSGLKSAINNYLPEDLSNLKEKDNLEDLSNLDILFNITTKIKNSETYYYEIVKAISDGIFDVDELISAKVFLSINALYGFLILSVIIIMVILIKKSVGKN